MTIAGTPLSQRAVIAEATRLLRHLREPGHAAAIASLTPDTVSLSSTRKGVTLGRGTVPAAAAELLIGRGLLSREPSGALALTGAGCAAADKLRDIAGMDGFGADTDTATEAREAAREAASSGAEPACPGRVTCEATLREDGESVTVRINEAESPLAWLHKRRDRNGEPFIDATCFEAGERLRRDLTMARIMPRVTSRWSPVSGGNGGPAAATDAMVSARQRLDRALDAVDGGYAGILLDVCGFLKRIEDVERERRWPPRSGKVVLKLALQRLAAHYGLAGEARGPDHAPRTRSWQAN